MIVLKVQDCLTLYIYYLYFYLRLTFTVFIRSKEDFGLYAMNIFLSVVVIRVFFAEA